MTEPVHAFLVEAGELLHRFGTPSHRLERVMTKISESLGQRGVFLYTPTALIVSLSNIDGTAEQTYLRRVNSGAVDVDKLIRFDEVLGQLERAEISLSEASDLMKTIGDSRPPFSPAIISVACSISCGAVAVLFGGASAEVFAAAAIGLGCAVMEQVHRRLHGQPGYLEPLIGFFAAIGALGLSRWVGPFDDRLVTLASLIIFLPGLQLTVGLNELAVGHLSAGSARLAGAATTLLTLLIGVAIGWQLAAPWRVEPAVIPTPLASWYYWLAIVLAPITFAVLFQARWRQWPVIVSVAATGFVTAQTLTATVGVEMGSFAGAFVVGVGSNLYARLRNRPALVALTPGIIVLVPGSIGYRSLAALLDQDTVKGIDLAFDTVMVAMALVGGILLAGAIVSPKRIL
jgi:uncharacterized membrane protein YjjP (DUF1212 family)